MSGRAHGQIRRGQVITTWGPGALLELPRYSAIVGGLDDWGKTSELDEIIEPILQNKLQTMTGIVAPRLYSPPIDSGDPRQPRKGITVYQFPEWFIVQEEPGITERQLSRRLVHISRVEHGRFEKRPVVPTRFVRACPKGHIDDLDWYGFVHGPENSCHKQLWLDERGTSGDLSDLVVRCECGRQRDLYEATEMKKPPPLGICKGKRPWLGNHSDEACNLPGRLLIRTAANAYFPQILSVLSLPDHGSEIQKIISELWDDLQCVTSLDDLNIFKRKPKISERLAGFTNHEILEGIEQKKKGSRIDLPVKKIELAAISAAPEGYGDDIPVDPNFHARRLPDRIWRKSSLSDNIESVIQLHRLREVAALTGFTRFEPVMPDIDGEYAGDVQCASLAVEPQWFPAIENRGEGIFVSLKADGIHNWLNRSSVSDRIDDLLKGHEKWIDTRAHKNLRQFPGGPYILLHTLSHLLIQSLALRCGYPASSIRERIYVDNDSEWYGVMLYTGSPDAEGTLGGLVQEARHIEMHLAYALRMSEFCSNDPVCAQHSAGESMDKRYLHGAACHACALIAETSCEMRNDYLDRALVAPVLGLSDAAFFGRTL